MDKPRVLYVDDEPMNLMLFEAVLENSLSVLTAASGRVGLEILSANSDLPMVISDMKMPNMSGLEFIYEAKKIAPRAKYYILSGFEITPEIEEAINIGLIRKYFRKPFNLNEISREVEQVLQGN